MATTFRSTTGRSYTAIKPIAAGAQGRVYKARDEHSGDIVAVKILNRMSGPEGQSMQARLEAIASQGKKLPKVFVLPNEIISTPRLGYAMPLVKDHQPLEAILSNRDVSAAVRQFPYFKRLQACYRLADGFRALHTRGMYYADISWANVLANTDRGSVHIIDNDNLDPTGKAEASIIGTPWFIAPELISKQKRNPDSHTDYHSLATLIYYILVLDHPLIGDRVAADSQENEEAWLSRKALFVHHPTDKSNRSKYSGLHARLPQRLRNLFEQSFVLGLNAPNERVPDGKWMRVLMEIIDEMIPCPKCGERTFLPSRHSNTACFYCGAANLKHPGFLCFDHKGHILRKALVDGASILAHHWRLDAEFDLSPEGRVARILAHPKKGLVLENLGKQAIYATRDGTTFVVEPQQKIQLLTGLQLNFGAGGVTASVVDGRS
jgi:DNA-binding helix-hairpin-helix protein with protein kinase domain